MPVFLGKNEHKKSLSPLFDPSRKLPKVCTKAKKKDNSICLPSSHANYRFLNPEQLTECMKNMQSLLHKKN